MEEGLRKRFCAHRGDLSAGPENSYDAIKAAAEQDMFYVEFDVMYVDDSFWTGHPPSEPVDELERILPLFEDNETFPKIDLKLRPSEDFREQIDSLLSLIKQFSLAFVLLNLGGLRKEAAMEAELYLAAQIRGDERIKLNVDLHHYRPYGGPIDDAIERHVAALGDASYALSPEIHREDQDAMGRFAQNHGIKYLCFWLYGLPSEPNPRVSESTLKKALKLEDKYSVIVLLDIDLGYVTE